MENKEVTFILFGGTGDLTRRKLVPAFARLVRGNIIGKNSAIIGISRRDWNDSDYKRFLVEVEKDKKEKSYIAHLNIKFLNADFSREGELKKLKEIIEFSEGKKCNRVFYLATSFKFFPVIVKELKKLGLDKNSRGFTRIIFEKPFGSDLKSSETLDKEIHKVFSEDNVFRLDHYLAKGTVKNLNVLKFTNPILYSTFGNRNIESIELIVDEDLGVGERIAYYNEAGALKDMVQNHLLQTLSLVLMERPKSFEADKIHDAKVRVLKNLEVLSAKEHLLGQYKSYADELKKTGLNKSKIETFAKIVLNCKMERWNGVKLILRTGKKLKEKFGQIRIKYKAQEKKFTSSFSGFKDNEIILNIYPKQDVLILMNTNTPEQNNEVKPVKFEFCQECEFGPNTTDEYTVLLWDAIKGDKMLFARSDEIRECWKIVEKIGRMRGKIKFVYYKDGSNPEEK